jgi:hypothetical protein
VAVTLYVLRALVGHSSSSSSSQQNRATSSSSPSSSSPYADSANCLRTWGISNSYGKHIEDLKKLQEAKRREANEFRRQSAPHELIRRVKEIEAEVAIDSPNKAPVNPMQKSEQEELQEQVEIETEQQGVPAVEDDELGVIERQLPPQCHPEPNTDFGGVAVRWGLTYHVNSAAECCKACLWHAAYARVGQLKCNVWVFCPEKNGCPSPDGYDHKFGECWLKQANQPQATVQNYSLVMRSKNSSPLPVLWISGVTNSNDG